ncbi:hypothetical protein HanHA300_Chr01g0008821 [Helianthus annuus]|nr:hypothetical protein HanHA300_Chr01g0008821 [Helianthus annuus]
MIGDLGKTWVGSLSQTGFTGNFTVVPTGGWVTGFSPELVVDSGYSRSTPFVQWVPRECLVEVFHLKQRLQSMENRTSTPRKPYHG